jgi:hypothetical protein
MLSEFSSTVGFMLGKYPESGPHKFAKFLQIFITKSLDPDRQALDSNHRIRIHNNGRNT